jgi:flagellar motor protein MotB
MVWFQVLSAVLIAASAARLAYLYYLSHQKLPIASPSMAWQEDPVTERLKAHIEVEQAHRRKRSIGLAAAILLGSMILLLISFQLDLAGASRPAPGSTLQPVPNGPRTPAVPPDQILPPPGNSGALTAFLMALGLGGFAVLVGALLLLVGKTKPAQLAGGAALLAGILGDGMLIKEVKFGDLLKIEPHIDKLALELVIEKKIAQLSQFGPQQVSVVENFESGKASLRPDMDIAIDQVCQAWSKKKGPVSGMLMIAGSTDRVPLAAALRDQYESNVGLARARAEQVQLRVQRQCKVPAEQILAVVAGPRHTPAKRQSETRDGFAEDRSVVVWGLWNIPAR